MENCKHPFGYKTRESGEKYCPLCRRVMHNYDDTLDWPTWDWDEPAKNQPVKIVKRISK